MEIALIILIVLYMCAWGASVGAYWAVYRLGEPKDPRLNTTCLLAVISGAAAAGFMMVYNIMFM